jgi:hypothetical protein
LPGLLARLVSGETCLLLVGMLKGLAGQLK